MNLTNHPAQKQTMMKESPWQLKTDTYLVGNGSFKLHFVVSSINDN